MRRIFNSHGDLIKKFLVSGLLVAAFATQASAASPGSKTLRTGVERVKAAIDSKIEVLGGNADADEADFALLSYLLKSSRALENTQDLLDLSDAGFDAGDTDAYLNNFALACNRVAASRAQLGNAARRAKAILSVDPTPVFIQTQVLDITDTRDSAGCPL